MKLVVGGCSFSSSFNVELDQSWPAVAAKRLEIEYIDQARTQGSNWRIWRTITNHILDGKVTPKDIVVIQYTEPHRQEIWSPVAPTHPDPKVHEPYDEGKLFKFKYGSDMYAEGAERSLSKIMFRFSNETYEIERFRVHHHMFCGFLKQQGFKRVYFLDTIYSPFEQYPQTVFDGYPIINGRHLLKYHLPGDTWHLSADGHRRAADLVLDHII